MIAKLFAKAVLKTGRWKDSDWPLGITQCIIIEAPHTSTWDFFWGKMYFTKRGVKAYFLIKKEMFFFPFVRLLKAAGGLPVDRQRASHLVDDLANTLKQRPEINLVLTPEATRKPVTKWKHGFFYIALKTGLPVIVSYIDYKKREMGILEVFRPTPDMNVDVELKRIKKLYQGITAKYPENFTCE